MANVARPRKSATNRVASGKGRVRPKSRLVRLTEDEADVLISLRRLKQKTHSLADVLREASDGVGR